MPVIEDLDDDECYLAAILEDWSGLDLAELTWYAPDNPDGCFRAWPFQWAWFRCNAPLQIDQCVAEGTLILTERGQVPIEDVRVGDMVLTHLGRWRPVTYTWDRGEQPVVTVKGHGHPGLTVTADHKFWIDKTWKVPAPDDRWETPWFFPPATVPALPSRTYAPGRPDNLPDDPSDPTFLWLYGLYVAEGSCSSSFGKGGTVNRTTFSVHEDEVEDVEQRLRKVGLRFNTHRVGSERCFNIIVNSRPLATWLSGHGGCGARKKHLAPWVLGLEVHQREAVLDGMTYGDGYTRGSGRVEYTTTSKALAADAKLLASSLGYFVTMTRHKGRTSVIDGRTIQGNEGFVVGWYMNGRHNHVDTVTPSGTAHVYDLEVAEDHSFVAESIVVSNCARSVGKTLSITLRMFAFPFLFPGQEAVITAPELVHLEPLTDLIESRFYTTRLGREMLPRGRGAVTHRPFMMNFVNNARIIGRIPQRDGKGVKGIHPLWLELDEAQDYPPDGWTELIETLKRGKEGAVWRAHGVTRGIRDKFYEYTQESPDNRWKIHRFNAMYRPNWTDEERQEKIRMYGTRDHPDYRRNVLGLHGDATNPLFVLHRLMQAVDDNDTSPYNTAEYTSLRVNNEMLSDRGADRDVTEFLTFPPGHRQYKTTWIGMDVGYCADTETEIMTKRGWLRWDEVQVGDESLAIDPTTGLSNWEVITDVYREHHQTDLVHLKGQSFDAMVTPHHRWLVEPEGQPGSYRWRQTRELNSKDRIPHAVRRGDCPMEAVHADEFVELAAWFWTEGYIRRNKSGKIAGLGIGQSRVKHPHETERIERCLTKLYGPPGPIQPGPGGWRKGDHFWSMKDRADGMTYFTLTRPIADELLAAAPDEVVAPSFLSALTLSQLHLFINISFCADGWFQNGWKIEQYDEARIKAFELACALAGLATTTSYDAVRGRWHMALKSSTTVNPVKSASFPHSTTQAMTIERQEYDGVIWCPTLKSHNWLARRNGSVYFTGNTNHPSEVMVFAQEQIRGTDLSRLRLITRVHLERISNPQQCKAIAWMMDFYKPQAFSMDKTGVGLPLFQDLQEFNPSVAAQIKGYNFSEKILVDFDDNLVAGLLEGEDDVKEAGIFKNVLEFSTDKLRELVDHRRLYLPYDRDLIGQFQGQTWSFSKEAMDMYGRRRRVYSQGSFHALDACRMAVLGFVQNTLEAMMLARRVVDDSPVFDQFIVG